MSRALDDLAPRFKPKAMELIARIIEHKIPILIVNTRRTQAAQEVAIATGHSWIAHSKHQDGLAIDLAPFEVWNEFGEDKLQWNESDSSWQIMGQIGQSLGLKWGVLVGSKRKDLGHFEL